MRQFLVVIVSAVIIGICVSIVFNPPHLADEILLSPYWTSAYPTEFSGTAQSSGAETAAEGWAPLFLGDELLFVHADGILGTLEKEDFYLHYTANSYVNIPREHTALTVRNYSGDSIMNLDGAGFPILSNSIIFMVSPDGFGVDAQDAEGNRLFSRRWASLVTTADIRRFDDDTMSAVGLLDGRVYVFVNAHEAVLSEPEDSELSVLYGFALHISENRGKTFVHLFTVEGFHSVLLRHQIFECTEEGTLIPVGNISIPLLSQTTAMIPLTVFDNSVVLGRKKFAEVYSLYSSGQELSDVPVIIQGAGDFQYVWQNAELNMTIFSFADSLRSEIKMYTGAGMPLFSSLRSFASAVWTEGSIMYQRNSGRVFLYRIEEG
ncbi:MAG: hypothetical protein ACR2PY_04400 [Salinispira sp.]